MIIGLLGGTFNPAHKGHLYISEEALKRLGLSQVWWLVSPGNPLKSKEDEITFAERFSSAKQMAENPKIKVLDIEKKLSTRYSIDTILKLKKKFPEHKFIWLMGADNLISFHKWKKWQKIFSEIDIAVFDRSDYFYKAISGKAGAKMAKSRAINLKNLREMGNRKTHKWCYVTIRKMEISSSQIRKIPKKQ